MTPRRSFLTRFGVVAAAFGLGNTNALAAQDTAARWQPAREATDDWFDQVPGKHRIFFDVLTVQGTSDALGFTGNYFDASESGYGLDSTDVAVVICLRHMSTPLAFGDVFWTKYGAVLGEAIKLNDPKTGQPSIVNTHRAALDALVKRGVHFAVCDMASHRFAGMVARRTDGNAEAVYKEMTASVIGNSRMRAPVAL